MRSSIDARINGRPHRARKLPQDVPLEHLCYYVQQCIIHIDQLKKSRIPRHLVEANQEMTDLK